MPEKCFCPECRKKISDEITIKEMQRFCQEFLICHDCPLENCCGGMAPSYWDIEKITEIFRKGEK